MALAKAINGDFQGAVAIHIKPLSPFKGAEADKFKNIEFINHHKSYQPSEIKRVLRLENTQSTSMGKSIAKGLAGGLVFGPVGALAGVITGGKKNFVHYGIEFTDGKKVILENKKSDQVFDCLIRYAETMGILEQNLGF